VTAGATAIAVSSASGTQIFGVSEVDLARCLQSAGDAACFSGARPVVRVATAGATAPGAPGTLTATASGSSVTLTWSAPTSGDPVATYVIEAGSASGLSNLAVVTTNSTATTFSAGGVGNGTYYVRIKAQNATGTSAASNEATLVVGAAACASAPNAPSGLTGSASGGTVTLSWTAPSGGCVVTSYVLQAGSATGLNNLANAVTGSTATTYVATAVPAGTYYVRVHAQNANGQSAASNEVLVTVGTTSTVSVTGRWIGVTPDGVTWDPESDLCDGQDDLQMDLTQAGSVFTGTVTMTVRKIKATTACSNAGTGQPIAVTGTINGASISFFFSNNGTNGATFKGTVVGNRMTGILIGSGDGSTVGTFAVTRQ
jgi:hypothetical protein